MADLALGHAICIKIPQAAGAIGYAQRRITGIDQVRRDLRQPLQDMLQTQITRNGMNSFAERVDFGLG